MKRQLTNKEALALRTPGRHSAGGNLFLLIRKTPAGTLSRGWTFKFEKGGVTHEMGLGSLLRVSPAKARLKAAKLRLVLDEGGNPWVSKAPPAPATETLRSCAEALIADKGAGWTPKHRTAWSKTIDDYLAPLADTPITAIDTPAIISCLRPLFQRIPGTAPKIRGKLEMVLASAIARDLRSGPNPAVWRGHLATILDEKNGETPHHAAMDYDKLPAFIGTLRQQNSVPARALEFVALTACRSGEARFARWEEIDFANKTWTIPSNRMKAGREHKIPLCDRAIEILESLFASRKSDFVFPGTKHNSPIGKTVMAGLMPDDATVHGLRSSFRDWCGEETEFPREICEHALAHQIGNGTEKAYKRKDAFRRRVVLMLDWARFCEPRHLLACVA